MSIVQTPIYWIGYSILAFIADCTCIFILPYHCYQCYKYEIKAQNSRIANKNQFYITRSIIYKGMSILTIMLILSYFLLLIFGTIGAFTACKYLILYKLIPSTYNFAKLSMYLIYVMRLHLVYNKSVYSYNNTLLIAYSIILIIIGAILSILLFTNTNYYFYEINLFELTTIKGCISVYDSRLMILGLSWDSINSIIATIAFLLPLTKINKALKESYGKQHHNRELRETANKIFILTFISSTSSCFAYIVAVLSEATIIFHIDIIINIICVIFMTRYYPKAYYGMCCVFIKCMDRINSIQTINNEICNDETNDVKIENSQFETRTMGAIPMAIQYNNASSDDELETPLTMIRQMHEIMESSDIQS
eukprot:7657_1